MMRYQVRNEYGLGDPGLYAGDGELQDDPEALLEAVAMAGLSGLLRQLGDLAEYAAGLFHDLHEEVVATACRGHGLKLRVQQLEADIPTVEKALIEQITDASFPCDEGISWNAILQIDENLITRGDMPRFVMNSYEECHGPPRLFMLDKFDIAGAGACLKRYSDPSFFKTQMSSSGFIDAHVPIEKRSHKIKKSFHWRRGETLESLLASCSHSGDILADRVSSKVPPRTTKLKHMHLKDLDRVSRERFKELLLDLISSQNKIISEYSAQQLDVEAKYDVSVCVSDSASSDDSGCKVGSLQTSTKMELSKVVPVNDSDSPQPMNNEISIAHPKQPDKMHDCGSKAHPEQSSMRSNTEKSYEIEYECEAVNDSLMPPIFDARLLQSDDQPATDKKAFCSRSADVSSDQDNYADAHNALGSESGSETEIIEKAAAKLNSDSCFNEKSNHEKAAEELTVDVTVLDYNKGSSMMASNTDKNIEANFVSSHSWSGREFNLTTETSVLCPLSPSTEICCSNSADRSTDELVNNYDDGNDLMDVSSSSSILSEEKFHREIADSSNVVEEVPCQSVHAESVECSTAGSYSMCSETNRALSSDGSIPCDGHTASHNSLEHSGDHLEVESTEMDESRAATIVERKSYQDDGDANISKVSVVHGCVIKGRVPVDSTLQPVEHLDASNISIDERNPKEYWNAGNLSLCPNFSSRDDPLNLCTQGGEMFVNFNSQDESLKLCAQNALAIPAIVPPEDKQMQTDDTIAIGWENNCLYSIGQENPQYIRAYIEMEAIDAADTPDANIYMLQDETYCDNYEEAVGAVDRAISTNVYVREVQPSSVQGAKPSVLENHIIEEAEWNKSDMLASSFKTPGSSNIRENLTAYVDDRDCFSEVSVTSDIQKDEVEIFLTEVPPIMSCNHVDPDDSIVDLDNCDDGACIADHKLVSKDEVSTAEVLSYCGELSEAVGILGAKDLKEAECHLVSVSENFPPNMQCQTIPEAFVSNNIALPVESIVNGPKGCLHEFLDDQNLHFLSSAENAPTHHEVDNSLSLRSTEKLECIDCADASYQLHFEKVGSLTTQQDKVLSDSQTGNPLSPTSSKEEHPAAKVEISTSSSYSSDDLELHREEETGFCSGIEDFCQLDSQTADSVNQQNAAASVLQCGRPFQISQEKAQREVSSEVTMDDRLYSDTSDGRNIEIDILDGQNHAHRLPYDQDKNFLVESFLENGDKESHSSVSGWEPASPPKEWLLLPEDNAKMDEANTCEHKIDLLSDTITYSNLGYSLMGDLIISTDDLAPHSENPGQHFSPDSAVQVNKCQEFSSMEPDETLRHSCDEILQASCEEILHPHENKLQLFCDKFSEYSIGGQSDLFVSNAVTVNLEQETTTLFESGVLPCYSVSELVERDQNKSTDSALFNEGASEVLPIQLPGVALSSTEVDFEKPPPLPPIEWRLGRSKFGFSNLSVHSAAAEDKNSSYWKPNSDGTNVVDSLAEPNQLTAHGSVEDVCDVDKSSEIKAQPNINLSSLPLITGYKSDQGNAMLDCFGSVEPGGHLTVTNSTEDKKLLHEHDEPGVASVSLPNPVAPNFLHDDETSLQPPSPTVVKQILQNAEYTESPDMLSLPSSGSTEEHWGLPTVEVENFIHISEVERSSGISSASATVDGEDKINDPPNGTTQISMGCLESDSERSQQPLHMHEQISHATDVQNADGLLTSSEHKEDSKPDLFSSEGGVAQPLNPLFVCPALKYDRSNYADENIEGSYVQYGQQPLLAWTAGNQMLFPGYVVSLDDFFEQASGFEESIRKRYHLHNMPRNPLIEEVAAHDRSTMRKVSELFHQLDKPKQEERNLLLEQIRNKSFTLKPVTATKPIIKAPPANLKVAAIVEKATAMRQAFVGSDGEDDNDSWSDS